MMLLILLAFSCNSKKVKSVETKEQLTETVKTTDSIKKMEEFLLKRTDELTEDKKFEYYFNEESVAFQEQLDEEIEIHGEIISYTKDAVTVTNGKIIKNKKVNTTNDKKQKELDLKEEKRLQTKAKIDSINNVLFQQQSQIEAAKEYLATQKEKEKVVKKSIFSSFWFWVFSFLLLLIVLIIIFRKWIGRMFPFLQFLKFFR
jgi:hypothetical protein